MKKLKKALIPIVALLAFSMLSTSVSAPVPEYYIARFYGKANGLCWVHHGGVWPPEAVGKGSIHVRGSAIVTEDADYYWAAREHDPNTRIWTRRTRMRVSWGSEKLMVYMWASHATLGVFNDTLDWFHISNLTFFGYGEDAALHFISGTADVSCGFEPISYLQVILYIGTEQPVIFVWAGAEYEGWPAARQVIRRVTVWGPIPWRSALF